ncbi:hypothetical protein VE02_04137 [Pseudogymnoascus sp. 03VT05]|nr:hypothetical protein VE02_04137 [Pseudogymnoascus sp. 03VT05]
MPIDPPSPSPKLSKNRITTSANTTPHHVNTPSALPPLLISNKEPQPQEIKPPNNPPPSAASASPRLLEENGESEYPVEGSPRNSLAGIGDVSRINGEICAFSINGFGQERMEDSLAS